MESNGPEGLEKNGIPVKIQEAFLPVRECPYIGCVARVNAHSNERWTVRHGRNDQRPVILKANEVAIEEMINARRQ